MEGMTSTRDKIRAIKAGLAEEYFEGKCQVTGVNKHKMGMVFHHENYLKGDRRREYPKGAKGDLSYFKRLEVRVSNNPEDFAYMASPVHQLITKIEAYKNFDLPMFVKILESRK